MENTTKRKYKFAVIATDIVIFTIIEGQLQVLLIRMKKRPYENNWAVPGGLVKPDESVEAAAKKQLKEKTGLSGFYLEQLYTFGRVNRDPFGRVVSVAYFALISPEGRKLKTTEEYRGIEWHSVDRLPTLAYDHREIINSALARLRAKLSYTNIVINLLPSEFTFTDLQKTYQVLLEKNFDKRNFRKKILSLGLIEKTGKKTVGQAHRPAVYYRFKSKKPIMIDIL